MLSFFLNFFFVICSLSLEQHSLTKKSLLDFRLLFLLSAEMTFVCFFLFSRNCFEKKMVWTAIHMIIRNDENPPHTTSNNVNFVSKEQAADHIMAQIGDDAAHPYIEGGKAFWVWEWRRKGNGDYFKVAENIILDDLLNINYEESVDEDDL